MKNTLNNVNVVDSIVFIGECLIRFNQTATKSFMFQAEYEQGSVKFIENPLIVQSPLSNINVKQNEIPAVFLFAE